MAKAAILDSRPGAVPARLRGAWRRRSVRRPGRAADLRSQVFWLQSRHFYADIRIPANTNTARREGFAGWLRLHGRRCRWVHHIEFGPRPLQPDVGLLTHRGNTRLHERGAHTPYTELWERVANARQQCLALTLNNHDERGLFLVVDDHFMYARATSGRKPSSEIAYGRIRCGEAVGARITLCTTPSRQGQACFALGSLQWQPASKWLVQTLEDGCRKNWLIAESSNADIDASIFGDALQ